MIGRDRELEELAEIFARMGEGQDGLHLPANEAGVGKTRSRNRDCRRAAHLPVRVAAKPNSAREVEAFVVSEIDPVPLPVVGSGTERANTEGTQTRAPAGHTQSI